MANISLHQVTIYGNPLSRKKMVSINGYGFPLKGYGFPLHDNWFPLQDYFGQNFKS